jgi:hypothetical protein
MTQRLVTGRLSFAAPWPLRPLSSSPEVAAGQDIEERHDRDDHEDGPDELLGAAQVTAPGEVDPGEHDGEWVQEADEKFEKLLHACRSPGFGGANPPPTARANAEPILLLGVLLDDEVALSPFNHRLGLRLFVAWGDKEAERFCSNPLEGGRGHLDRSPAASLRALADERKRLIPIRSMGLLFHLRDVGVDLAEECLVADCPLFAR